MSTSDPLAPIRYLGENDRYLDELKGEVDSPQGVIPFVGAGLSIPFGYPSWRGFLLDIARRTHLEQDITALLKNNDYEGAATRLMEDRSQRIFTDDLEDTFGEKKIVGKQLHGAVMLVPKLAKGPVITTNFDRVLERAFVQANKPFEERVWGPQPDLTAKALRNNSRFLLKLHGDVNDRRDRVLTVQEYNHAYGTPESSLASQIRKIISWRTLLFIGCSLQQDRTMEMMLREAAQDGSFWNFALIEFPDGAGTYTPRSRFLGEHNIRPIWFPVQQYQWIEHILEWLVSGSAALSPIYPLQPYDNQLSNLLMSKELPAEVRDAYRKAVEINPKSPVAHYKLALLLDEKLHLPIEAEAAYRKAIELDAKLPLPHVGLGVLYRRQGRFDLAIAEFEQAVVLNPKDAYPHNGLGQVYYQQGQFDQAIVEYQHAIELNPKDVYPHNGLGDSYYRQENFDQAAVEYQHAITLDPKYSYSHNGLGNVYRHQTQFDRAINEYQTAIKLNPQFAAPHNGLARVYFQQGHLDQAAAEYQRAIALEPNNTASLTGLGNVYFQKEKFDRAAAEYQRAIALDPKHIAPHNGLGNVYFRQGHFDQAAAEYQRAIELDPNNAAPHNGLGDVYFRQEKFDQAAAEYQRAIALDPNNAAFHSGLGKVYYQLGLFDQSITEYQSALDLGGLNSRALTRVHNQLGNIYEQQAQFGQALAAYQLAIEYAPTYVYPHHGLGNVYYFQGHFDQAIAAYQLAITLDPKFAPSYSSLGKVYKEQGLLDQAIAMYQKGIQLNPENPRRYTGLIVLLRQDLRPSEALPLATKRYSIASDTASAAITLAGVLRELGNLGESRVYVEKARELVKDQYSYSKACIESIVGNVDAALDALQHAKDANKLDKDWAKQDPDLKWIRDDPRFAEIVK